MEITPPRFFNLDRVLVVDVETDALYNYTTIHCVVCVEPDGTEHVFRKPLENKYEKANLLSLLRRYHNGTISGHNFLSFDLDVLLWAFPGCINPDNVLDTLVLSRLFRYNQSGGHSLERWGDFFGFKKEFANLTGEDFKDYSEDIVTRCISDVQINLRILKHFKRFLEDPQWHHSIWLEHFVQQICREMTSNGFRFDVNAAKKLYEEVKARVNEIDELLLSAFPPKERFLRRVTPRLTKKGTVNAQDFRWASKNHRVVDRTGFSTDPSFVVTFTGGDSSTPPDLSWYKHPYPIDLYELEEFNPGSVRQIVERMNEAGWRPTEKTKGHIDATKPRSKVPKEKLDFFKEYGWKVSETNLKTLPKTAPESAQRLAERLILASRLSDLEEWLALQVDGRIHGRFNGIGAWTHRLSHYSPNTANIPVGSHDDSWMNDLEKYLNSVNNRMRGLFLPEVSEDLVGTDADGIQMRIFAHLVNDERLTKALIEGKKEDGTDIHSLHKTFLGSVCQSRDHAKTFIYAFLLGAGIGKVSEIFQCSFEEAKKAVNKFLEQYPGLKALKRTDIPRDACRGYFIGLDGRKVVQDSEHLMLSGYLQNGEKIIMARWIYEWVTECERQGIPYRIVDWIHDEVQSSVKPEYRERFQQIQLDAMVRTGEILGMNLPLLATSDHGTSWEYTH